MKSLHMELKQSAKYHILERYISWRVRDQVDDKLYIPTRAVGMTGRLIEQIEEMPYDKRG